MEELSIQEKAKAYDKAIAYAKKLLKTIGNATLGNLVLKNEFKNMFPQLEESEDERIRKALIRYFTLSDEHAYNEACGVSYRDIVAWLEKQGKKTKPIEGFNTEFERQVSCLIASAMNKDYEYTKDFVKWTSDALLNYAKLEIEKNSMGISEATKQKLEDNLNKALEKETPESCNEFLEKQGEQECTYQLNNLKSKVKFPFEAKVKSSGAIVTIHGGQLSPDGKEWIKYQSDAKDKYNVYEPNNLELVCEIEQKSDDKAEPKFHEGDIIKPKDGSHEPWQIMQVDILDKKYRFKDGYVIHFSHEDNYELVEQTPTWSEEDEKMIRGLIVICDEWTTRHSFYPIENCEIEKLKNWLESLKERYTWKPSDEQMDTLKFACGGNYVNLGILESLYVDLKKLRKE